jgi:opacity protein-like surface antigen
MRTTLLSLALISCIAAPSAAQVGDDQTAKAPQDQTKPVPPQTTKPKPKPAPRLPLGFHMFGSFDMTSMSASSTFSSQTGSSSITGVGGGGEVLNVWRQLFVRFGISQSSVDGTRGYLLDDGFVSTQIPLKIGVRYVELAAGWRNYLGRSQRIALYGGGGLTLGTVKQESPNAVASENSSATGKGSTIFAGLEYAILKNIVAGVEGQFRSVRGGVLGEDNTISGAFGEDNAGGSSVRALIGIRFRK